MIIDVVKFFLPSVIAFIIGVLVTPLLTSILYKNRMWKKKAGKKTLDGDDTPIFNELHKEKEVGTPKMGGIVIWFSVAVTIIGIWALSNVFPTESTLKLDFLSRSQTWIPLFTLLAGAFFGLIDDYLDIKGIGKHVSGGLPLRQRLAIVAVIGFLCGGWFFFKLGVSSIGLPGTNGFIGEFLVLLGAYKSYPVAAVIATTGVVLAAVYLLWALQRVIFNKLDNPENATLKDLDRRELTVMVVFAVAIVWLGFAPGAVLRRLQAPAERIVEQMHRGGAPAADVGTLTP